MTTSLTDSKVRTLALTPQGVEILDQTLLPARLDYQTVTTVEEMARAIETMVVRGAPAIGIAGAYGVVLSARTPQEQSLDQMTALIRKDIARLAATRPTAVNLAWALNQMEALLENSASSPQELTQTLARKAETLYWEDIAINKAIGNHGKAIVPKGAGILTHCNAGALATAGYGTALGVVRASFEDDSGIHVYADETRPRLQGARLTTWELAQDGIPVTLLTDGMSGSLMRMGKVDVVIVGADRIAANGDTANKIGTYNLALVAHAHDIPFYIAAPLSTIDMSLVSGQDIPIEERDPAEIYEIHGESICAEGIGFYNPSFDVTPARYLAGIITEKGIARPDYTNSLPGLFE